VSDTVSAPATCSDRGVREPRGICGRSLPGSIRFYSRPRGCLCYRTV